MSGERAETYLRQFAENLLRRVAGGELASADCASRVDAVAAAFEGTGVLSPDLAQSIASDVEVALAARSPERSAPLHPGRRASFSAMRGFGGASRMFARATMAWAARRGTDGSQEGSFGKIRVVPAGATLRVRGGGGDEDIYLLGFVAVPGRAWLSVAARTNESPPQRRPASPPSARNAGARRPRPSTFAGGGMTATDDAGRRYDLGFSGGGGAWYTGRLMLSPVPPADIAWLDVRCGTDVARVDLSARTTAEVSVRATATSRAEAYLLQCGEAAADRPASAAANGVWLADVVSALDAVGALPSGSPVPGQLAALLTRLGLPGHLSASPEPLPERWAALLAVPRHETGWGTWDSDDDAVHAARLAAVLPPADRTIIALAGLITRERAGTLILGSLHAGPDAVGAAETAAPSLWLRDDAGDCHSVSISGWSGDGPAGFAFQATVVPPLTPSTERIEVYVTGPTAEARGTVPLEWWGAS